jgi:glycogen synthase
MRVAVLSWEYPPRVHGGLGRHVHAVCRELLRIGHDVHVVTTDHPRAPAKTTAEGVIVHRVRPAASAWPAPGWPPDEWLAEVHRFDVALRRTALHLVGDGGFDVVHAHDWMVGAAGAHVAARMGLPLVVTIHATERGRHQGWLPGPLNRWIDGRERELAAGAAEVIVCSRAMAEQVAAHLGRRDVHVVANGVDVPARASRVHTGVGRPGQQGGGRLLFVGRLEHEKGVHVLLHALQRLRDTGRPVRLAIAGEGTQRAALEALAQRLRLRRSSTFLGFCDPPVLAALRDASHVAVVPSLYEPFGLVALEAMAAGTPLVATRTGGLAELVRDGEDGLLVPPEEPDLLAGAIARVLDDPVLAGALRSAGRRRATVATWQVAARRTEEVYAQAVAPGGRAPGRRGG